jgi:hypothetical protein
VFGLLLVALAIVTVGSGAWAGLLAGVSPDQAAQAAARRRLGIWVSLVAWATAGAVALVGGVIGVTRHDERGWTALCFVLGCCLVGLAVIELLLLSRVARRQQRPVPEVAATPLDYQAALARARARLGSAYFAFLLLPVAPGMGALAVYCYVIGSLAVGVATTGAAVVTASYLAIHVQLMTSRSPEQPERVLAPWKYQLLRYAIPGLAALGLASCAGGIINRTQDGDRGITFGTFSLGTVLIGIALAQGLVAWIARHEPAPRVRRGLP